jgi:AcrR family transcriptional regulator
VELALGKEANATSRAALLDRMLDRRDAELARLEAAVPQPPAPPMTPKDDFLEQIARIFERQILNDPPKWLRAILGSVLSAGVVKLNAEAKAAAQRLHAILEGHPPAPYTEAWWALERAAGRNGSTGFAGYQRPARATAAGPMVRPEDRSKRVDDLGTLDAAAPIPPGHALVSVRPDRAPAPPEVMERWYGANWQDGPWGGR